MIIIIVGGVVEAREGLGRNVEIMQNLDPNGGARSADQLVQNQSGH